jgi:hypothetical protein
LLGRATVLAVQFASTPEPDFVGVTPEELSYEETASEASRVSE